MIDKADHASIYDGCALSDGEMRRFLHNDMDHLDASWRRSPRRKPALVVIDGVFSMEGDIAPLPEIVEVCKRYEARLLVDDAHAIGVIGKGGRGTASHYGLEKDVDLISRHVLEVARLNRRLHRRPGRRHGVDAPLRPQHGLQRQRAAAPRSSPRSPRSKC